jgi:hypothetical protein
MLLENFRKYAESGDYDALVRLYAEDALLDVNVPAWRFQRQGRAEIRDQYAQWYPNGPAKIVEFETRPTEWGAVIEVAEVYRPGIPNESYARTVEFLVVADDLITRHTAYCTGPWDLATVERHEAAAPMVRTS